MKKSRIIDFTWDLFCLTSVLGIWPRFIEPSLLFSSRLELFIDDLPSDLENFSLVQLSDLHFHAGMNERFLRKIQKRTALMKPDLLLFTGDFLCFSDLSSKAALKKFLRGFEAPYGFYACLGNHDYAAWASVNRQGDYDLSEKVSSSIAKGFQLLFRKTKLSGKVTPRAQAIPLHTELLELLAEVNICVLENETRQVEVKGSKLNLCGLGDLSLGRSLPEEAFRAYDKAYPGLVLSHNPDSMQYLKDYPGELVLAGHTHGAQVNLPWIWKKFVKFEKEIYKSGLFHFPKKLLYVNRGLGSPLTFRFFAPPEILEIRLKRSPCT